MAGRPSNLVGKQGPATGEGPTGTSALGSAWTAVREGNVNARTDFLPSINQAGVGDDDEEKKEKGSGKRERRNGSDSRLMESKNKDVRKNKEEKDSKATTEERSVQVAQVVEQVVTGISRLETRGKENKVLIGKKKKQGLPGMSLEIKETQTGPHQTNNEIRYRPQINPLMMTGNSEVPKDQDDDALQPEGRDLSRRGDRLAEDINDLRLEDENSGRT